MPIIKAINPIIGNQNKMSWNWLEGSTDSFVIALNIISGDTIIKISQNSVYIGQEKRYMVKTSNVIKANDFLNLRSTK